MGGALLWVSLAVMALGLLGSVVPGLPGVPLIFLAALSYAYLTEFETVGVPILILLGVLAAWPSLRISSAPPTAPGASARASGELSAVLSGALPGPYWVSYSSG